MNFFSGYFVIIIMIIIFQRNATAVFCIGSNCVVGGSNKKKNDKIKREMKKNPLMKQCKKKNSFYHILPLLLLLRYICNEFNGYWNGLFFSCWEFHSKAHTHTDTFDQNILLYRFCNNDNNNKKKIDQFRFNRLIHHHIIIIIINP